MEKFAKYETQIKDLKNEIFQLEENVIGILERNFNKRFSMPAKKLCDEFEWRKTALRLDLNFYEAAKTAEKKEELMEDINQINKRSQELRKEIKKFEENTKEERKKAKKEIKDKERKKEELKEELKELCEDYFDALVAKFDLVYYGSADALSGYVMYADKFGNARVYIKIDKYGDIVDLTTSI